MKYILSAAAVFAAVVLLLNPDTASAAVGGAVHSCLEVIVPSLFSLAVIAVYLQSSGLYRTALKPLTLPLSKLLKINEELCAVIILGNIGGYPVGARLLSSLVSQGRLTAKSAGKMLCCCYGSGPSFIVCIVGMKVFGSAAVGGVIFGACFLSSLIIAVILCRNSGIELKASSGKTDLSPACFINSVAAAARVLFTVCAMIIGFSAVSAVLDISGVSGFATGLMKHIIPDGNAEPVLYSLLEISRIKEIQPCHLYAVPLTAALLSFGGVCVIMQIKAVSDGLVPMRKFLLWRLPAAGISAVLSCAALLIPQGAVETSAGSEMSTQLFSVNMGMSLSVIIMCGILLGTLRKTDKA